MGRVIGSEIVIFLSFLISSVAGFAGAAISIPLTSALIGLDNARAAINIISIFFNANIVRQQKKDISVKKIAPVLLLISVGMVIGFVISRIIRSNDILLKILGVLILTISILNLFCKKEIKLNLFFSVIVIILSGIFNYLFLCGGIILVLYMSQKFKIKEEFRGNNALLFLFQSLIMMMMQLMNGVYNAENLGIAFAGIIPVVIATAIGKQILKKIDNQKFKQMTYGLLIVMAIFLIF